MLLLFLKKETRVEVVLGIYYTDLQLHLVVLDIYDMNMAIDNPSSLRELWELGVLEIHDPTIEPQRGLKKEQDEPQEFDDLVIERGLVVLVNEIEERRMVEKRIVD
jgi:hypothetical protein